MKGETRDGEKNTQTNNGEIRVPALQKKDEGHGDKWWKVRRGVGRREHMPHILEPLKAMELTYAYSKWRGGEPRVQNEIYHATGNTDVGKDITYWPYTESI